MNVPRAVTVKSEHEMNDIQSINPRLISLSINFTEQLICVATKRHVFKVVVHHSFSLFSCLIIYRKFLQEGIYAKFVNDEQRPSSLSS